MELALLKLVALVPPKSAWLSVQDAKFCTLLVEAQVASFVLGVALASARLSLSGVGRSGVGRSGVGRSGVGRSGASRSGAGRFVSLGAPHLSGVAMLTLPLYRCL